MKEKKSPLCSASTASRSSSAGSSSGGAGGKRAATCRAAATVKRGCEGGAGDGAVGVPEATRAPSMIPIPVRVPGLGERESERERVDDAAAVAVRPVTAAAYALLRQAG